MAEYAHFALSDGSMEWLYRIVEPETDRYLCQHLIVRTSRGWEVGDVQLQPARVSQNWRLGTRTDYTDETLPEYLSIALATVALLNEANN